MVHVPLLCWKPENLLVLLVGVWVHVAVCSHAEGYNFVIVCIHITHILNCLLHHSEHPDSSRIHCLTSLQIYSWMVRIIVLTVGPAFSYPGIMGFQRITPFLNSVYNSPLYFTFYVISTIYCKKLRSRNMLIFYLLIPELLPNHRVRYI